MIFVNIFFSLFKRHFTWLLIISVAAVIYTAKVNFDKTPFPFAPFPKLIFDLSQDFKTLPLEEHPLGAISDTRDFSGVIMGHRRMMANMGWITVLQYYGGHENQTSTQSDRYRLLKKLTLRILRLDPSFHYATLYGAGALAWNLNRPDEALEILQEAIHFNPSYWRYRLYVGAILFKQQSRFDEMLTLLENAIRDPDCPTMLKSILANIYKSRKNYSRALEIWQGVLIDPKTSEWYQATAQRQIEQLTILLKNNS